MRPASFAALVTMTFLLAVPFTGRAQALPTAAACSGAQAVSDPSRASTCAQQAVELAQDELSRAYRSVWAEVPTADRATFLRQERAWLDGRYAEARRCAEREAAVAPAGAAATTEASVNACLARLIDARRDALLAASPKVVARKVAIGDSRSQ